MQLLQSKRPFNLCRTREPHIANGNQYAEKRTLPNGEERTFTIQGYCHTNSGSLQCVKFANTCGACIPT